MPLPPLYKYLDVQGAHLTLGNRTFKHAKPSDFNDTEDLTVRSIFPEPTPVALKQLRCGFTDVILQHLNDPPTCSSPMKEQIALFQRVYRSNPEAADKVKAELAKEGARPVFDINRTHAQAETFLKLINEHLQANRVLCVTTHKDSEKMWSEYAENHKGIALRIEPALARDSKFQLFRPVIYREKRPPLYEDPLDFIAGSLFGDFETRVKAALERIIYSKTLEWARESEYRLAIPLGQNEKPWNTLSYHPEEISELYLGSAMAKMAADSIICMALEVNRNIKIFRAKRDPDGGFIFNRI